LPNKNLIPNFALRSLILDFKASISNEDVDFAKLVNDMRIHLDAKKKYIDHIKKSITTLTELSNNLEEHLFRCKVSNTSGNIGTIAGTALLFTTVPIYGAIALTVGGLTSIGTSITQYFIEKNKKEQIREVLKQEEDAEEVFNSTFVTLGNSIDAGKTTAQALFMLSKIRKSTILVRAYNNFKATGAANLALNSAQTASAAKAITFPKALKIGARAKWFGFVGAALSAADIVMTWKMDNETLEQIKQCIKDREKKLSLQEQEAAELERIMESNNCL